MKRYQNSPLRRKELKIDDEDDREDLIDTLTEAEMPTLTYGEALQRRDWEK